MPVLRLEQVAAGYGTFQALFDVSLEVRAGEAVAVIGPNGAGKTTLLRVISKLIEVSAGEIRLEGASLNEVPAHRVIELGVAHVPENRRLFPRLSVEDNLRIGAYTPAARARFAERLAYVFELFPRLLERRSAARRHALGRRAADVRDRPRPDVGPEAAAARRAVRRPGAGDRAVRCSIWCGRIRAEGFTVLIVEQNIRQVLQVVDRAYLLETGRIELAGTAAELLASDDIRRAYLGL